MKYNKTVFTDYYNFETDIRKICEKLDINNEFILDALDDYRCSHVSVGNFRAYNFYDWLVDYKYENKPSKKLKEQCESALKVLDELDKEVGEDILILLGDD